MMDKTQTVEMINKTQMMMMEMIAMSRWKLTSNIEQLLSTK
jgi:hypothetical protein